jgi:lantibiotic modifying enzyme
MWGILTPSQKEMVSVAVQSFFENNWKENHSLCHGELGNLAILKHVQSKLNIPDHRLEQVKQRLKQQIEKHGFISGLPNRAESLSFMLGLAGMGLSLLYIDQDQPMPPILYLG